MRVPVVAPTFDELVAETVRELEDIYDERLLALSEDELLRQLADYHRHAERAGGGSSQTSPVSTPVRVDAERGRASAHRVAAGALRVTLIVGELPQELVLAQRE